MLYKALTAALGLTTVNGLAVPARAGNVKMQMMAPGGIYRGGVTPVPGGAMGDAVVLIQGGSLRTWSYRSPGIEQVQVILSTEGRPLDADVEVWHGPDNTPCKMRVYVENGQLRPFSAVIETPRGPNTVAVRNIGQVEFPIAANCITEWEGIDKPTVECLEASATSRAVPSARTLSTRSSTACRSSSGRTDGRSTRASSSSRARTTTSRSSRFTPRMAATGPSSAFYGRLGRAMSCASSTRRPSSSR